MTNSRIILTCEHAGNRIPGDYAHLFTGFDNLLQSHRGWDIGAAELVRYLAENMKVPVYIHDTTRLLVDVNRSLYRRTLFSELTKSLAKTEKQKILNQYYYPHRTKTEQVITGLIQEGYFVLHISIHSFTPVLRTVERNADIGILYNPERKTERNFAKLWKAEMHTTDPDLRIRFNYPYRGKPDGFPAWFRKKFNNQHYAGYEFEVNQKYFMNNHPGRMAFMRTILTGLLHAELKFFGCQNG